MLVVDDAHFNIHVHCTEIKFKIVSSCSTKGESAEHTMVFACLTYSPAHILFICY